MPRRPSSIDRLPEEVRAELQALYADPAKTLDDLVEHLEAQGFTLSRSAVGRDRKQWDRVSRKIRESREVAQAFARELGAVPEGEMGRLLVELTHNIVFNAAMASADSDEPVDPRDLMFFAKAIRDLAGAQKTSTDLELSIRKELQREVAEKAKQTADAAVAEARERGLSDDAAESIRARIMGIATA